VIAFVIQAFLLSALIGHTMSTLRAARSLESSFVRGGQLSAAVSETGRIRVLNGQINLLFIALGVCSVITIGGGGRISTAEIAAAATAAQEGIAAAFRCCAVTLRRRKHKHMQEKTAMRYVLLANVLASVLILADQSPAFAADCKAGSRTLTGVMGAPMTTDDGWTMAPLSETKPCDVSSVQGKGRIPPGCSQGDNFTATGTVRDELGIMEFIVKSIKCTP
jgi:hypothetical protein